MTRGYVCIVKGKEVVNAAFLTSDAYLSYYGLKILEAINKPTIDEGIKSYVQKLKDLNLKNGYKNDIENFNLNWIKPDKESRADKNWVYEQYGYIYDVSNYYLKVYHRGKLIVTVDTDDQDDINKHLYLFEHANEIYENISYDEDLLDSTMDFGKVIKTVSSEEDIEKLKERVSNYDRLERVYLSDTHLIAPGHRPDRQVYEKKLHAENSAYENPLRFIVEHDVIGFTDYGWNVLIQTPWVRVPITIGAKKKYTSEKALMKDLRLFVKDNSDKLLRLGQLFCDYEKHKKENSTKEFFDKLDAEWAKDPWYVENNCYFTVRWIGRECRE